MASDDQTTSDSSFATTWQAGGGCLILTAPAALFPALIGGAILLLDDGPDEGEMLPFVLLLIAIAAISPALFYVLAQRRPWAWLATVAVTAVMTLVVLGYGLFGEAGRIVLFPAISLVAALGLLLRPSVVKAYLSADQR
ncbi:hypothetical protein AB0M47_01800 [Hamadaea sp. NPDC051192]|uniref:hypothetical protein n=1 Tax=Hamadaea sp. NPDC051192 TaxID=3154940 RepID=UPI00343CC294